MNETYSFSNTYQQKLASLLLQDGSSFIVDNIIKPEYFEEPEIAQIVETILSAYSTYGLPPTFEFVEEALKQKYKDDSIEELLDYLQQMRVDIPEIEVRQLKDSAIRFAKHQKYKEALRESIHLLREDNLEQLEVTLESALSYGNDTAFGIGSFYFSDIQKRLKKRLERPDVLCSLIPKLDAQLADNGFAKGELNVFLGLPSSGKSFALDHMAKVAIIQKKKVVFYTLEMSIERVAARLDASFAGVEIRELRDNIEKLSESISRQGKRYGNSLLLKEYPAGVATVGMLKAHLTSLRLTGFTPDVVIVDYINLLAGGTTDRYSDLGQIYIDLRGLAQERNTWLFTAAQCNRSSFDSNLISMKDVAESFQGAMHSDVLISLNQTDDEAAREAIRLYIAKDRNGIDKVVISGYTNFRKGSFWRRS